MVLQTGSVLGENKVNTSVSTNIIIMVGSIAVGAIQSLSVTEDRTITMIDELGTDGHIDGVPTKSTNISGDCKRIRFDALRVAEAFGRNFWHVHSQRLPFDIDIYDTAGNGSPNSGASVITKIKGVWIQRIQYTYDSSNWIIAEDMSWMAQGISSTFKDGSPVGKSSLRGITPYTTTGTDIFTGLNVEQNADIGKSRGSLDAPNLLGDVFSNL